MYGAQCWNAIKDTRQSSTNIADLKTVLLTTLNDFPQQFIDTKAIVSFRNRLQSCFAAAGPLSEHSV